MKSFIRPTLLSRSVFHGICLGFLFGLGECASLASRYGQGTGHSYIYKILILYMIWGVLVAIGWRALAYVFAYQTDSLAWLIGASIAFSLTASMLLVRRDYFYYDLNAKTVTILISVFLAYALLARVIERHASLFSLKWRLTTCLIVVAILTYPIAGSLVGQKKTVAPADTLVVKPQAHKQPNILILLVDALDASRISALGFERKTTPHIDALARDGIIFTNYHSPLSTGSSTIALFTGIKPEATRENFVDSVLGEDYYLIGELMKDAGYSTAAFSWTYYVDSLFGFGQGMDHFENLSHLDPAGYCYLKMGLWHVYKKYFPFRSWTRHLELFLAAIYDPKETAQDSVQDVVSARGSLRQPGLDGDQLIHGNFLKWLDESSQTPFFAYVHLQGAHAPYIIPETHAHDFVDDEVESLAGEKLSQLLLGYRLSDHDAEIMSDMYDTRLHFADSVVGMFVNALEERRLMENTVVIVLGDHGAEFLSEPLSPDIEAIWEEYAVHSAMVMHYPAGIEAGQVSNDLALATDIMPTLAGWVDQVLPVEVQGKPLIALKSRD